MFYYKTRLMYEGSNYAGFQWQSDAATVQSEFNLALAKIISGKVTTMAASRTDTGVHALDQVVKITSSSELDLSSFLIELNLVLPRDMKCISIENCDGSFKPSVDSQTKEYLYFFTNKSRVTRDENQFVANISNPLNIDAMNDCIRTLHGVHDFCNFYSSGSNVKSTVRHISACELSLVNPHDVFFELELFALPQDLSECYQLRIIANGFLKQMIRHIVSALWMVGTGKISTPLFMDYLHGEKSLKQLWKVAPPNGLYLYKINY